MAIKECSEERYDQMLSVLHRLYGSQTAFLLANPQTTAAATLQTKCCPPTRPSSLPKAAILKAIPLRCRSSKQLKTVTYLCQNSGDNRERYLGKTCHTNTMVGYKAFQWRRRCSKTTMSAGAAHSGTRSMSACAAQPVPSAKSSSPRLEAKMRRHPCERCTPCLSSTHPRHKRGFFFGTITIFNLKRSSLPASLNLPSTFTSTLAAGPSPVSI
jgi:hypothetical protein